MFYRTVTAILLAFSFASLEADEPLAVIQPLPKLEEFLNNYPDDGREITDTEEPYFYDDEDEADSKEKYELWQLSLVRKLKKDYEEYVDGEFFLNYTAFFTNIIHVVKDKEKLGDILRELVEAGADINAYDKNAGTRTMLEEAASEQDYELCELLLQLGADPDSASTNECITPLLYVASSDNLPLARLLLRYGADVNSMSRTVYTPLHSAVANKQLPMCRLLLAAGASPIAATRWGETPLHMLLDTTEDKQNNLTNLLEIMRLLLDSGADASACTERGDSVLKYAVYWDEPAICRLLLEAGASPDIKDSAGKTPLQIAEEDGSTRAAEFLRNMPVAVPAKSVQEREFSAALGNIASEHYLCFAARLPGEAEARTYFAFYAPTHATPAASFQLVLAYIALKRGIISPENTSRQWSGYTYANKEWNKDMNLQQAIHSDCTWYFHRLADEIGAEAMQEELRELRFGNADVSDWNGELEACEAPQELRGFWLRSSLRVAPEDELRVMEYILSGSTPLSPQATALLREALPCYENGSVRIRILHHTFYDTNDYARQACLIGTAESAGESIPFLLRLNTTSYKGTPSSASIARLYAFRLLQAIKEER